MRRPKLACHVSFRILNGSTTLLCIIQFPKNVNSRTSFSLCVLKHNVSCHIERALRLYPLSTDSESWFFSQCMTLPLYIEIHVLLSVMHTRFPILHCSKCTLSDCAIGWTCLTAHICGAGSPPGGAATLTRQALCTQFLRVPRPYLGGTAILCMHAMSRVLLLPHRLCPDRISWCVGHTNWSCSSTLENYTSAVAVSSMTLISVFASRQ